MLLYFIVVVIYYLYLDCSCSFPGYLRGIVYGKTWQNLLVLLAKVKYVIACSWSQNVYNCSHGRSFVKYVCRVTE